MGAKEKIASGCLPMFLIVWGLMFAGIPISILINGGSGEKWIAFIFIPLGLGAIVGGIVLWKKTLKMNHIMEHGERVYAKLLSIKETGGNRSRRHGRVTARVQLEFEWTPPNTRRCRRDQEIVSIDIGAGLPEVGSQFRVFSDPEQPEKCLVEDHPVFKLPAKETSSKSDEPTQKETQSPSPTLHRNRLRKNDPIGTTQGYGKGAIAFGAIFVVAGLFPVLISLGVITPQKGSVHAPMWVIGIIGGMFMFAGLSVSWAGWKGHVNNQRLERERAARPKQAWLWDYAWEPLGISSGSFKKVKKQFYAVLGIGIFLIPFNWLLVEKMKNEIIPKLIIGIFDLILVLVFCQAVYSLFQHFKYGESRLSFADFPFYLGRPMQVTLNNLPANVASLEVTLRYIEEVRETSGSGKNRSTHQVCYELHSEAKTLSGRQLAPRDRLPLKWDLPDDKRLTTRLSEMPLRYWQLEAKADTQGIDFHCTFLLPVYAKS